MSFDQDIYQKQGFGNAVAPVAPYGLLIIDFINGFADPLTFGGGNIAGAIECTRGLLAQARQRQWPVVHTRVVYQDDGADANIFALKVPPILALREDASESQIVPQLQPVAGELVLRKTSPSAFFGTSLAAWLSLRGTRTLLIAGCTTSGCVRASVVDAMCHGFRPLVVTDCVGDRSLQAHDANLFDMNQKYATLMARDVALEATTRAENGASV
ncbi:maleamate amidohydrolase [Variovorax beijingensis]|uniref:Maleamate amidohydrolase n=2 Tax=Variovorax TaxID=34072 RepID=A0AAE3Y1N7_VARPD|nr:MULTISPECIES: isochorismatase family protein [Variovorax]MBD9667287.1 isochorismatase family protein [Variovorax sp. VRV01]MDP9965714.1 maleamate amidohydrolase [Variovorax paradoxus]MDR6428964.1 maleamate amidohydrolase [Variovorax paradoxus]MDR6455710.1 maleamate amidohydrolase [Variovorax paradoxus]TWD77051.1 maleamate amidohydrolase [Variovorax beijingensis]